MQSSIPEPYLSFLCGGFAGALSRTAVSPIERVKVLFQVQGLGHATHYKGGTLSTVAQIYHEEGYRGLFRGNGTNCIRIIPYTAIQYMVYEEAKLLTGEKLLSGMVAGIASVVATYPLDLAKTRLSMAYARGEKSTIVRTLQTVARTEGGLRACYRGVVPTALGVGPYVALNFTFYEQLQDSQYTKWIPTPLKSLLLGALSGGAALTSMHPLDLLRRRFQARPPVGETIWSALSTIVRTEGVRGLYRGWGANMWKIMPSMAVQWGSYDSIKKLLV
ncbi:uncharacterized protein C5L36_0A05950 [Pichia kudriavzevii]|uniref:Mitochondrial carrier n=1 Tax=Pichia kudriavzevii TaxID=4909 RepID=A0A2U9QY89_PICKU|nr:uncharacterized protein C5L36_0A05950 [Pichia kudriavzevii]AWU74000.1 hypothetical protein C5L36_0A05950 [Pichia kudriavzevii]